MSVWKIALSRGQSIAKQLIGEAFEGIVGSDRCTCYGWLENGVRQICWAHLLRDFQAMAERTGVAQEIGESLLERAYRIMHWWHRSKEGKMSRAMWTFVYQEGIEPTNNVAEQALRPAVIWRGLSFGSQSESGSKFVARMLRVNRSLKAQGRSVLDFLTESCIAARHGTEPPSLIPTIQAPPISKTLILGGWLRR